MAKRSCGKEIAEISMYDAAYTEMQDFTLKIQDPYQPQDRGGGKFGMVRPSLTRGRCGGSGRASAAGGPGCAAAAGSLQG